MAKARTDASAPPAPDAGAPAEENPSVDTTAAPPVEGAGTPPDASPAPSGDAPPPSATGDATPPEAAAPAASETPAEGATSEPLVGGVSVAEIVAAKDARIAELEALVRDLEARDADARRVRDEELDALHRRFDDAWQRREAEIAAIGASPAARPASTSIGAVAVAPFVGHSSLTFRGRVYEPGAPFPFDPKRPPEDVAGPFVEGLDFFYR
jgi:hypothetical protein